MKDRPAGAVRRNSALRQGGWSIADQLLSSGTQLLLVVLVARHSSAALFGAVSVAVVVHGFLLGSVRALVGDVVLIRCQRPGASPDDEARTGLFLVAVVAGASGLVLALLGTAFGGDVGRFLVLFALAAPIVHAQDLLRSVAYGRREIGRAVTIDGVWLVVQVVVSGGLVLADRATASSMVVAWIIGAAAGLAVGCALGRWRPSGQRVRRWVEDDRSRSLGFLGDYLVSNGVVQASFLALGAMLPLAEFGSLRLAYLSVNPLANVLAGVRSMVLARLAAARGAPAEALRTARRAAPVLAVLAAAYGIVLTAAPRRAGVAVFGGTWTSARDLVAVVALGEVARLATFPAVDVVRVFAPARRLVRIRVVASACLVVGILGGGAVGGARGAATGMASAVVVASIVWWAQASGVGAGQFPASLERSEAVPPT